MEDPFPMIFQNFFIESSNDIESSISFKQVWNNIKRMPEYQNISSYQKKKFGREKCYEYIKKHYKTKTSCQNVSFVYNLQKSEFSVEK
jgi:hypothetical protein